MSSTAFSKLAVWAIAVGVMAPMVSAKESRLTMGPIPRTMFLWQWCSGSRKARHQRQFVVPSSPTDLALRSSTGASTAAGLDAMYSRVPETTRMRTLGSAFRLACHFLYIQLIPPTYKFHRLLLDLVDFNPAHVQRGCKQACQDVISAENRRNSSAKTMRSGAISDRLAACPGCIADQLSCVTSIIPLIIYPLYMTFI